MQILSASACGLSRSDLSPAILEVIESLTKAGYEAYLVGGGVRDLMLGEHPKDFDAVTNATPSQIKKVFGRRCRIIGRRFELAHVHSGREMIEVATFRAPPKKAITSATGMVLRDNNWGTIEQDFARRDFTVNSFYYQPFDNVVLDFCHAYKDIKSKTLKLLGDADQRFEEDPVRMLRTLRFAAKLDFKIHQSVLNVFTTDRIKLLREVSPHRLYDESQKMFSVGRLEKLVQLLDQFQVWQELFIDATLTPLVKQAARNTDQRLASGKTVNSAFFYAVLLWQPYLDRIEHYHQKGIKGHEARVQAGMDVLKRQATRTIMPRFAEVFVREVWEMQSRLVHIKPQHIMTLAGHTRFRAGFDFLMLREQIGDESTQGMAAWWENFQYLNNDGKERAIADYRRQQKRLHNQAQAEKTSNQDTSSKSKSGKSKVPKTDLQTNTTADHLEDFLPLVQEPIKPRRQRNKSNGHRADASQTDMNRSESGQTQSNAGLDHPILRRRRVQRDLKDVIFGPTRV
ncbi:MULTISPECIES: polynucleotide adenylyltransferase PcnB [unclassified Acinetobacter]|uniref:polynucleotide adenylyltransferase PcnB n=1 Tax=unclassified Acinetobacter TaxID=196816 RepID=UPI0035BB1F34